MIGEHLDFSSQSDGCELHWPKAAEERAPLASRAAGSNETKAPSRPAWFAPEAPVAATDQARESASAIGRLTPTALAHAARVNAVSG